MELNYPEPTLVYVPALLSLLPKDAEGFFATSISTMFTTVAFPLLTPYQTVYVFMFLTQILVFQLLGIVPFNLNNVLNGDHGSGFKKGKRKKRGTSEKFKDGHIRIIEQIFRIFREIDKLDCIKRSLCEVQAQALLGRNIPTQVHLTLEGLKMLNKEDSVIQESFNQRCPKLEHIQVFVEAANVGYFVGSTRNSTYNCWQKYSSCPITTEDILEYMHSMRLDDFM